MVGLDSESIDYELNSPVVYLRSLVEGLSTLRNGNGGSEQIHEAALTYEDPPRAILVEHSLPRTYDLRIGQKDRTTLSQKSLHNLPKLSLRAELVVPSSEGESP
jgi:hypothetical protein